MQDFSRLIYNNRVIAKLYMMPRLRFCGLAYVLRNANPFRDFWMIRYADFTCLIIAVQDHDVFFSVNGINRRGVKVEERLFARNVLPKVFPNVNQFA